MSEAQTAVNPLSKFVPHSPDDFTTGQPDKFTGVILKTVCYPYKGAKSETGKYNLFAGWLILPDADTGYDLFFESVMAGYLNEGIPSKDGKTPAGMTVEQYAKLAAGEGDIDKPCVDANRMIVLDHENVGQYLLGNFRQKLSYYQAYQAVKEADLSKKLIDWSVTQTNGTFNGFLGFADGLRCRFDRVPQDGNKKDDKKPVEPGKEQKDYKVLVVTEVLEKVDPSSILSKISAGKPVSAGAGSSSGANGSGSTTANFSDDFISRVQGAVVEVITEAKDHKMKKALLMAKVPAKFKGQEKADAMAFCRDEDNLLVVPGTTADYVEANINGKTVNELWLTLEE